MTTLKYTIIKSLAQYNRYCKALETLTDSGKKSRAIMDEIELLTLLIEKYDAEHASLPESDPVQLIRSLMKDHGMKAVQLARLLNVSEGLVSDMLHYRKGLSKETIRLLAAHFKLNQEALNRPYAMSRCDD